MEAVADDVIAAADGYVSRNLYVHVNHICSNSRCTWRSWPSIHNNLDDSFKLHNVMFRQADDAMEAVEEFDEIEKLQHQGINAGDVKVFRQSYTLQELNSDLYFIALFV